MPSPKGPLRGGTIQQINDLTNFSLADSADVRRKKICANPRDLRAE